MAKKKFDTNPLDPTFPERAKEAATTALPKNQFKTAEFPPVGSMTEEETRRFNESNFDGYRSVFDNQKVPAAYQSGGFGATDVEHTSKRKVAKVGLPENIMTALPYIPFFIGLIAGILELLFVPKSEAKVRFHAAQGLAAHIGILIVTTVLNGMGKITDLADVGNWIFHIVTFVMLVIFTVKAFLGKPVHIESVDELTEWLDEKIKPRD